MVAFTNPNYKRFDDDSNMVSSRSSKAQNSQTMLSVISFKPTWKNYKNWNSKSWYDESNSPSRLDLSFQTFTHLQQGMPSTLCLLSFSKFQIPKLRKTTKTTQVLAILNHLANLNTKYSKGVLAHCKMVQRGKNDISPRGVLSDNISSYQIKSHPHFRI